MAKRKLQAAGTARQEINEAIRFKEKRQIIEILENATDAVSEGELARIIFGKDNDNTRKRIRRRILGLIGVQENKKNIPDDVWAGYKDRKLGANDFSLVESRCTSEDLYKGYKWHISSDDDAKLPSNNMPLDTAIALELSRKFLKDEIPERNKNALGQYFKRASKTLSEFSKTRDIGDFNEVLRRVEVGQRTFTLTRDKDRDDELINYNELQNIYDAIAKGMWISFDYAKNVGQDPEHKEFMYPGGIIMKPPKIYLYAAYESTLKSENPYYSFQAHLISNVVLREPPQNFNKNELPYTDIKMYMKDGWDEVLKGKDHKKCKIKIEVKNIENLIRDLKDFKVDRYQTLEKNDEGVYILEFEHRISAQLIEYIVGRGDAFKVLEPEELRSDVEKMARLIIDIYK